MLTSSHLPDRIPLFPLPLVLFPGQVKALRIFEPRYRQMLQDCLRDRNPFGIVLQGTSDDPGSEPDPYRIGTSAHIMQVARQPDDTYGIQIHGGQRFRIRSFQYDRPYLQGDVDPYPLRLREEDNASALAQTVSQLLPTYLEALTKASGFRFNVDTIPTEPDQLAYLAAIALQANNDRKQELLAIEHLGALLHQEAHMLVSELDLMAWINDTIEDTQQWSFGSGNDLSLN